MSIFDSYRGLTFIMALAYTGLICIDIHDRKERKYAYNGN